MSIKKTNGFTIVEVALVLAIAGLIFLMVFIALPSLQRLQRDTARREDMTNLIATIKKFQSNNRGSLPTGTGTVTASSGGAETTWGGFYQKYLGNDFVDPLGKNYELVITNCGNTVKSGEACDNSSVSGMANATFSTNNGKLMIVLQANCDGIQAVGSSNPRKIAVLYVLEGSGLVCMNS